MIDNRQPEDTNTQHRQSSGLMHPNPCLQAMAGVWLSAVMGQGRAKSLAGQGLSMLNMRGGGKGTGVGGGWIVPSYPCIL